MNPDSERIRGKLKHSPGPKGSSKYIPEIQLIRSIFNGNPVTIGENEDEISSESDEEIEAPIPSDKKSTDDILQIVNQAMAERGRPVNQTEGPKRGFGAPPMQQQFF